MIHPAAPDSTPSSRAPEPHLAQEVVFVARTESGGIEHFRALKRSNEGDWLHFCAEIEHSEGGQGRTAQAQLLSFAAGNPVIVECSRDWARVFEERDTALLVGLDELAPLLRPSRRSTGGKQLLAELLPGRREIEAAEVPRALRSALGQLIADFLESGQGCLALASIGYSQAAEALQAENPLTARVLRLSLALAEFPSLWTDRDDGEWPPHPALRDGALREAVAGAPGIRAAFAVQEPHWCEVLRREQSESPVQAMSEGQHDFPKEDLDRLDHFFEKDLPKRFGENSYRAGQHRASLEIAASLGKSELLLVHAPTGTGKTLAYLLPAMLWSIRHKLRIGLSTFTRALQEQAMDREVPLALALLKQRGVERMPRVSLLKGRQNYLCWRALENQAPFDADDPAQIIAWTRIALFGLRDPEGDLDRLPRDFSARLDPKRLLRRTLGRMISKVRAESGCCRAKRDRESCAAHAARHRAERSHVVISNHSFSLACQGFFRYAIFDECEHLHDQAHSAWSHNIGLGALRDLLLRLKPEDGDGGRTPLARAHRSALRGSVARRTAEEAIELHGTSLKATFQLQRCVAEYKAWREEGRREREDRDEHSLLREYAENPDCGAGLVEVHRLILACLDALSIALAELSEHLDSIPTRGRARLRRSLDLIRTELDERLGGLRAWMPLHEGRPSYRPETFYDVETDIEGRDSLAARVLLPHEYLGRHYFPELSGAVCLSATTYLGGSFSASSSYLGLERAANPAPNEDRPGRPYRTFRAPDPFNYERVLVAIPRDAPPVSQGERRLDYACEFVKALGRKTRGRILVLFTNSNECIAAGKRLKPYFEELGIPLWYQRMEGVDKEELAERFRETRDSILLGLDTFWYGADFPGDTLQYLVIARLPYGVPDRYHHAQRAALGAAEQHRSIYMPRALAKFRQGFGRLMRRESDRGCVFILDPRALEPRHRSYLRELPLADAFARRGKESRARLVRGDRDHCLLEAMVHMGLESPPAEQPPTVDGAQTEPAANSEFDALDPTQVVELRPERPRERSTPMEIPKEDLPF